MAAGGLELKLDAADLRALYIDLRKAGGGLQVDLRRGIKAAAKPAADAVKASAAWSSRIPGAVQTKATFGRNASVAVIVNAKKAPEAAPLNNKDQAGTFTHPVWGNWSATQQARPFFGAAAKSGSAGAERVMLAVMDDVARKAGFR